jgi:hypothetical protein
MGYHHHSFGTASSTTRHVLRLARVCALLALTAAPLRAQTHPVTIAWDASPDSSVIGYAVYVATEPGGPGERFDVSGTSFVYPDASDGHPYFFSVAAFSAGGRIGTRSDEIMFFGGGVVTSSPRAAVLGSNESAGSETETRGGRPSLRSADALPQEFCLGGDAAAGAAACYAPAGSVGDFGDIESLKPLGDGRLIFIENSSRIVISDPANTQAVVAVAPEEAVRLVGIAIDPTFTASHLIYVAAVESFADGTAQLNVARYREVGGQLGERAVIVSGVPVLQDASVRLAADSAGHLFVAVPGAVLRYQADGTVPTDNQALSPLYARSVNDPVMFEFDAMSNALWVGERQSAVLQQLRLAQRSGEWPRALEAVATASDRGDVDSEVRAMAFSTDASQILVVAGEPAALVEATRETRGALRLAGPLSSLQLDGVPTAAVFNQHELDVAIRSAGASTRIVRFRQVSTIR